MYYIVKKKKPLKRSIVAYSKLCKWIFMKLDNSKPNGAQKRTSNLREKSD